MLATLLRPKKFSEIIGQKTVVTGLRNYIKNGDLPNVIALIGASGCGKNTIGNVISMVLNCQHPVVDKDGYIEPCGECPCCKDIIDEHFQRDVHVYSGSDINVDKIKEIENIIMYSSNDRNTIIQINEAQQVKELRRFLEIIEQNRKNVYFILTSTDKDKFTSSFGKDNKTQEKNAFRSRVAYFNIKAITTDEIKNFLFSLLEKIDPEEKIPDTFMVGGMQVIAENAKNNLRQAINDFSTAVNSEVYDANGVRELLGYEDEHTIYNQLYMLASKNKNILTVLQNEVDDLTVFFNYTWKILTDTAIRESTGIPYGLDWKEKTAKDIISTGNIASLIDMYDRVYYLNSAYFNDNVFIDEVYRFINNKVTIPTNNAVTKIKKIKTIKETV